MTAVFAHRGCTERGIVENTLEAFAEARRLGADGVELDVRLTADGALAVHHDAEVPGVGTIPLLGVSELPPFVPLLTDVLDVCDGMTVNVEIKNAPQDPGWDGGEAVAALDGGGDRGGGLDRAGHRVLLPAGHATGGAGGRRPSRPRRPVGLRHRPRARSRRGGDGRASAPSTPSSRPSPPSWWRGPMPPAWPSTCGPSTPSTTCAPWWWRGWMPSSRTSSASALAIAAAGGA